MYNLHNLNNPKYYVLDFQRLDRLLSKDKLDMGVRLGYTNSRDGTKWPRIDFVNIVDGKMFLRIRSKYSPQSYKLNRKRIHSKEITTVRKNKPLKKI